jgi:acetyl esterase/lipase
VLTRPAPPPDATVPYGDDPNQVIDLHLPAPGAMAYGPVVMIHGGFWMAEFDRVHTRPLVADLVAHGYPVANIEYRRIGQPGGGWPGTLDDVAAAIRSVPAALGDAGTAPPVLMGHSAGGQLALWAARRAGVRGVVALAPVADLAEAYQLGLGGGATGQLLGGGPADVPERYAIADPSANLPIGVPTVVVHGELDRQVPYQLGRDFAERAGVAFVGLAHSEHFALIDPRSAVWPAVRDALIHVDGGRQTR